MMFEALRFEFDGAGGMTGSFNAGAVGADFQQMAEGPSFLLYVCQSIVKELDKVLGHEVGYRYCMETTQRIIGEHLDAKGVLIYSVDPLDDGPDGQKWDVEIDTEDRLLLLVLCYTHCVRLVHRQLGGGMHAVEEVRKMIADL